MPKLVEQVTQQIENAFRYAGFPAAHRYGDGSGVVKIIEGESYDIEIDLGRSDRAANVKGGIGVCLFVRRNDGNFDYRQFAENHIVKDGNYIIKLGDDRCRGVIVKCWLDNMDWRRHTIYEYRKSLFELFNKFHRALSDLVTAEDIRDKFLVWAMYQRMEDANGKIKDANGEINAWTSVRNELNQQLAAVLRQRVGELAGIWNINYLDLEQYLERSNLLKEAEENWLQDNYEVPLPNPLPNIEKLEVSEVKKSLVENAYVNLFNEFLRSRKAFVCQDDGRVRDEISKMHATEYLIKMLGRSQHGKIYENYVVAGIWGRIGFACKKGEITTCPRIVTQQLVRRDGPHRRALLDLYFPEIRLAVECDEAQHRDNIVEDALREEDVVASGLIQNRSDLFRVDATASYVDIDKRLNEIVDEIVKRVQGLQPIVGMKSPVDVAHEREKLSVDDGLLYQTRAEALEALGIRKWRGGPRCSGCSFAFYVEENKKVMSWRVLFLDLDKKGGGNGWSQDDETIILKPNNRIPKGFADCAPDDNVNVIVFIAQPNNLGYSFAGVYGLSEEGLKSKKPEAPLFLEVFNSRGV